MLSIYKTILISARNNAIMATCGAIGLFLFGLTSFLWMVWQTTTISVNHGEKSFLQQPKTHVAYPTMAVEQELAQLYGSTAQQPAKDSRERFRIQSVGDNDSLLLAAPRARLNERLVGILTSSNPDKNIAIVDGGGKQSSYGLSDKIAGKFAILRIFDDRVVINEDGFYATLLLAE